MNQTPPPQQKKYFTLRKARVTVRHMICVVGQLLAYLPLVLEVPGLIPACDDENF